MPDREACLRAVRSRDDRFDGVFVNAVRSTGIYCRPSCPAVTPRDENMTFYPSAAAAVAAGYRACRRCRPDASPGSPEWDVRSDVVARAMRLIRDGVVDREGVPGLAARLGYSERQLERLMLAELGAGPAALARAQRAYTARLLIESTTLPMGDVAFAAGFSSVRSFNEAIAQVYATTPRELRQGRRQGQPVQSAEATMAVIRVRLPRREPFVVDSLFGHLAATSAPGVEEWRDGAYRTTMRLPHGIGIAALTPEPSHIGTTLWLADPRDLAPAIARCRALLDLDADPDAVGEVLGADPVLGPLWRAAPGRRVPRCIDAGEFALRAVLAQQISVRRAANLAGRLAARAGEQIRDPKGSEYLDSAASHAAQSKHPHDSAPKPTPAVNQGLTHVWPTHEAIAAMDPETLPMPRARGRALVALAERLADGTVDLSPGADRAQARAALLDVPGVGPWTVEVVALRGLGDPDAFPAGDLGVRHGLARLELTEADSARWRPWRAYAVQYLWASDTEHEINRLARPTKETA
ncbi:AlkA N-terminal domain-containing protein [Ammonicoccus fulvus]|uniref:DNA-3-methyladenine glycosylase II n=1 Tax=Ammonicoccus fulvus TaxID=3138240 RepID=A0ABZ3FNS1_9ACTN